MPAAKTVVGSFVYLVQVEGGGRVKIGRAKQPDQRIQNLRVDCPFPLQTLAIIPGAACVEHYLHARFDEHRAHGEWFEPSPEMYEIRAGVPLPAPPPSRVVVLSDHHPRTPLERFHRFAHIEQAVCEGIDTPDAVAFYVNRELDDVAEDMRGMHALGYLGEQWSSTQSFAGRVEAA